MARTTTTRGAAGPRRRSVLAGGAAALTAGAATLLTGCAGGASGAAGGADAERGATAERLRAAAGRDSAALLERYDATARAHDGLAARLRPLRAEVARHAEAFGVPAASSSGGAAGVPGDEKAALAALAGAERRTADARTAALTGAPPELARLLASVAAAGAAHAYLLGGAG
ncbi:lipoprotein [Streptomyces eurocidicus]|uniref:Lipoprotein n=1 Tax=Streptomyces eurocidicus TaxID=66423 RepID=A0A2N8NNM7_STREU|nr:hypothetical protein [Streptomyces eurocidicus]MBB5116644.1 hypothetical protein [Streptomyces eurocidicus]MBF6052354.1 hypothetical protein [Streptomyces eurocidicus]PNE30371.1 lipoprotein [Streptomyces eurocidicus]